MIWSWCVSLSVSLNRRVVVAFGVVQQIKQFGVGFLHLASPCLERRRQLTSAVHVCVCVRNYVCVCTCLSVCMFVCIDV